ncbi:Transcription initiation factor TFIID subunit 9 [Vanrija pseudolonga]|uniref:Transcription initiation factor TFIID subunit 9 n=1 Tax=Vanrija pseudolonga TaxID=143232 RepID=A0AAF0YES4_9TREE|nr:Transcription initiation factor TFIID subunit 9 [Vanrija pseudolonga]
MANTSTRTIPRDGRLLALILASKGIADSDERVIHQLLDFAHRYTADVLQSAQALADHAARTGPQSNRIEKEDVELAIQMRRRYEFFEAPPRDRAAKVERVPRCERAPASGGGFSEAAEPELEVSALTAPRVSPVDAHLYLASLAHELNAQPLPPLSESFEMVRLPPASQRLTEVTFDLVPTDAAAALSDDELRTNAADSESESESDEDADGDAEADGEAEPEAEADAAGEEDDEMEEVGVPAEREVDEDYDA